MGDIKCNGHIALKTKLVMNMILLKLYLTSQTNKLEITCRFSAEKETPKIHIYDGRGESSPLYTVEKLHYKPVTIIKVYNIDKNSTIHLSL